MLSDALVAQSQAQAWSDVVKQELVATMGSLRVTENRPVGKAGRLEGVAVSDTTSGGGAICVMVAVGALYRIS